MPDLSVTTVLKRYGWYMVLGVLLIALVGVVLPAVKSRETYSVVCLGDSIIGNVRDESSIPGIIEFMTGKTALNGGFGGMNLACVNSQRRGDIQQDAFSLVGIVEALLAQDFSWQKSNLESNFAPEYYEETIREFENLSWNNVDVIVIEYGVNDYLAGVPLDNPNEPYDKYTFGGALRYVLRELEGECGDKKIILCTPTYCWFPEEGQDCERDNGYGTLADYVELEKRIAAEFGVEVLDNYNESGIGTEGESWAVYTTDGIHLNDIGRRVVAERIVECIEK